MCHSLYILQGLGCLLSIVCGCRCLEVARCPVVQALAAIGGAQMVLGFDNLLNRADSLQDLVFSNLL